MIYKIYREIWDVIDECEGKYIKNRKERDKL